MNICRIREAILQSAYTSLLGTGSTPTWSLTEGWNMINHSGQTCNGGHRSCYKCCQRQYVLGRPSCEQYVKQKQDRVVTRDAE